MLVKEVIQRIQSLYSKGAQSDDSRLTSRHIYSKVLSVRAKLLSEQSKKKQFISQWNYQTLSCVELIGVSSQECQCVTPFGCTMLRTKHPLPKPLSNYDNHLIQSVTSVDGNVVFSETTWTSKKYKAYNKYTAYKPDWFFRNGHLYVTYRNGPKVISVTGLFEDPHEALKYPAECKTSRNYQCMSPLDMEFPIDTSLVEPLIELSVNELLVMFSQAIEDVTNDSKDSAIEQTK